MGAYIILGGGGGKEQSIEVDKYFVRHQQAKCSKMMYIPIAMDERVYTFSQCFTWIKSVFEPLGLEKIDMITDLKSISYEIGGKYSSVYIGGGNTFNLLKEIRDSGFDIKLLDFIKSGGCVYGGSAGAIILGSDIDTASHKDPNDVMIDDFTGLNVVKSYAVWCHYQASHNELIKEYVKRSKYSVIAIPEASGIAYDCEVFKNVGSESCYIFRLDGSRREVEVDEKF